MLRFRPIPASAPAALAALAFLCAAALYAEDTSPTLDFVVTASRTPEAASKATALVTTVTAEEIAASASSNAVEALEKTLGVTFRSYSGDAEASVSMRGFGDNAYGRVLVLIDGKRLNHPDMKTLNWLSIPIDNIDHIEVLHGSASVLYGGGAVGGVINIITRKPKEGMKTGIGLSFGQDWENGQNFDLEMGGEKGNLISTVSRFNTEGYRDRSEYTSTNGTVSGTIFLADPLHLNLGLSYSDVSYQMPGALTKAQYEEDPTQATNKYDEGTCKEVGANIGLEWFPSDNLTLQLPVNALFGSRTADMPSYFSDKYTDTSENRFEVRPQATWETKLANRAFTATGGADFRYVDISADAYSDAERTTKTNNYTVYQWELGPFASLRYQLLAQLALEAGARWESSSIEGERDDGTGNGDKFRTALVYDAGLNWQVTKGLSSFVRWATTFRYPFTDEQTWYSYSPYYFNSDLEPEKGRDLSIGGIWQPNAKFRLEAQGYWLEMTDEIAYTTKNVNMDETRRLGADLAVNVRPISFLNLDANYSFVDARFANGSNEDKIVPLVSAHSGNASATIELPIHVSFGPTLSYRSEQYTSGDYSNSAEKIDAYFLLGALFNIKPRFDRGELTISARVDNLLDQKYAAFGYYGYGYGDSYYPGEGRTFRISVRYRH